MLKQAQLIGTTVVLLVASTAGGAYLWWQSTPQFALLEARNGYLDKNRKKFNKYVDVATLTTEFTDELIFAPAEKTPNLSKLQRVIGLGAIRAARTGIDNSLIFQIQKLVNKPAPKPGEPLVKEHDEPDEEDAPKAGPAKTASSDSADTKNGGKTNGGAGGANDGRPFRFTSVVKSEWKKEKSRLKQAALERMSEFAKQHPDTIINRIFAAPVGGRANAVKQLLAECGFKGSNFKKYQLEHKGTRCIAHLTFMSPRINDLVTVKLEMERLNKGPFGRYRISRLVEFKKTLNHLKYDTDDQIHGLVAYGLQDLKGETLAAKAKAVLKSINESAAKADDDEDEDMDNDGVPDAVEEPAGTELKAGVH